MRLSTLTCLTFSTLLAVFSSAAPLDVSGWYPLSPGNENGPSVIGMESWLEKPAGKRGPILMDQDRFVTEDGTPIKFWGVNLGGGHCAPARDDADYWAERFARYGINCVRLHKYTPALLDDNSSTAFKAQPLDQMDYFSAELVKRGIYYGWSPTYHHKIRPGDLDKLIAGQEILDNKNGNVYGLSEYAEDVQDLLIEMTVNLLNHENPYTGLRYAEDPALAFVEFHNEVAIMFWGGYSLDACPTYQKVFIQRFNDWLKERYRTHEALVADWGEQALDAYETKGEHLDKGNIWCLYKMDHYTPGGFAEARQSGLEKRMLVTLEFLHEAQNKYYAKFEKAVRDTGYRGPLVASCWRAKGSLPEFYNLRSDYLIGIIDRHNYHGGLSGWKPRAEPFNPISQLNHPGSGLISSGFLQVADRPFAFSEWNTVFPNEYALESPALIAAYGMGLQDWDGSYQFATRTEGRGYSTALHVGNLLWNIERPDQIGLYPVYARMIYRGDVEAGDVISTRRIALEDLENGELNFGEDQYTGFKDIKIYEGSLPGEAIAAGRVVVEFVDEPEPSTLPDMSRFEEDAVVRSNTGQLVWDHSRPENGFFTVNTPATKGVVGFQPGQPQRLGHVTIDLQSPFAAVFLTSLEQEKTLDDTASALLAVVGRMRNTGMKYSDDGATLEELGDAPILLEPVKAQISIDGRRIQSVELLDHDGRSTGETIETQGNQLIVDGKAHKTFYYHLRF